MRRIIKALIRFIFFAVPLFLVVAGAGFFWMARSLPPVSGSMNLQGLTGPVTISRDENGVPHIAATSMNDVFSGLGFAHAQDRLWQMEVSRMAAQGRLSEMFGEPTVDTDIWLRSMGIFEASETSYEDMPESGQDALKAYAAGVNAWIEREGRPFASRLPPEFVILGHTPEPWEPAHTVGAIKMMSVTLGANLPFEVMRLSFARLGLSADEINDLLPPGPGDNPPPLPDLARLLDLESGPLDIAEEREARLDLPVLEDDARRGASNNWVLAGDRTTTGLPVLANDPHLSLSAPSIWYLAHLRVTDESGSRNLVGATLAGAPLVLLGRSDTIAWGFTNTASDVQDIFIEKINPDNADEYLTPDGWKPFGSQEETIKVSGNDDVTFDRRWTRHGPVLPMGYRNLEAYLPSGTLATLQWVALAKDDTTVMSGIKLWDSTTVAEFQDAMADYVTPMQSMVVADRSGDIGLIAPGRVPIRNPENQVMGRAPVPGWDPLYDWQGMIPFDGLPRRNSPAIGAIATANAKMVGPDYPYFLTFDWEEAWRQDRLDELVVEDVQPQSVEMSRDVQADVFSTGFAAMGPQMIRLIEGKKNVDPDVIARLKNWDYQMVRESAAPLIFIAWVRESMIGIFKDDLGPTFDPWFRARGNVMVNVLAGQTARNWCDNRSTPGEESCADILAESLERALVDLEERFGTDRENWQWGGAHLSSGEHTPFGKVPILKRFFDVQVASPGGPFTLDRGVTRLSNSKTPYVNVSGASFRGIYDFADLDNSTYIITTGQSGNPFSRHYRDFAVPWSNVESIRIPTDPASWEPAIVGSWQLVPR
ncbi:MAG: penicillin acylase family protein [Alphaproteobacteria bacterium]|nr:penicillin acylase family protein [Alphaproteobacteria bacterium]